MPHITFLTHGTRGDVEPLLAVALRLAAAGYVVRFAGPIDFISWIEGLGLPYHPLGSHSVKEMLHEPEAQGLLGFHPFRIWRALKYFQDLFREILVEGLSSVPLETDLIVAHASMMAASDVAEAAGVPVIFLSPVPIAPTKDSANLLIPFSLGPFNRLSYLPVRFGRLFFGSCYHELRRRLGLPRRSGFAKPFQSEGADALLLHLYSPALLLPPADWPPNARVCGYAFLDQAGEGWQPDAALAAFLTAGPVPVYIGFGSMVPGDAAALSELVYEAVRLAGVRAVIAAGWAGMGPGGEGAAHSAGQIHYLKEAAPHHRLFPLCAAVVHHGGAGTTAAGLRAGRPTLICPFGFDQPFWGRLVHGAGLGPTPQPVTKLTAETLAAGIKELVNSPHYRMEAANLAERLATEDGVIVILKLIKEKTGGP